MPLNSSNPALGIGQSPGSITATNGEAEVACAIYCCDKKPYSLKNNRGGRKTCQRLAHRKHSCVLHKLREKNGDKLTQTNKFKNIYASPRYKVPGIKRVLIPDTIVGNTVIDAKFPCDPAKVHKAGFTKGKGVKAYPSTSKAGSSMMTKKERREYKKIEGVKRVKAMTPSDAAKKKGKCKCST